MRLAPSFRFLFIFLWYKNMLIFEMKIYACCLNHRNWIGSLEQKIYTTWYKLERRRYPRYKALGKLVPRNMTFLESNVDTCSVTEWKNTLLHSSAASVLTDGNHKMNNLRDPCHFLRQGCNNRGNPHFVLYRRDLIFRSDLAYHSQHTTGAAS